MQYRAVAITGRTGTGERPGPGRVRDRHRRRQADHHLRQAGRRRPTAPGRGREGLDPEEPEPLLGEETTMKFHSILGLAAGAFAALALSGAAMAQSPAAKAKVDEAKAGCVVGEQADGYLGFVKPAADPQLKAAVEEINAGRAALYRQVAAKNGVTPE